MENLKQFFDRRNFENKLAKVLAQLSKDSAVLVEENIMKNFETESFDGKKWQDRKVSKLYLKRSVKKGKNASTFKPTKQARQSEGRALLVGVRGGKLKRSITVTENKLVITANAPVVYAAIHNDGGNAGRNGSAKIPQRRYMGTNPTLENEIKEQFLNLMRKSFK